MIGSDGTQRDAYLEGDGHDHRRWLENHDGHDHDDHASHDDHSGHDDHAGHDDHGEATWQFGASVMGGFLLPILFAVIFPPPHRSKATKQGLESSHGSGSLVAATQEGNGSQDSQQLGTREESKKINDVEGAQKQEIVEEETLNNRRKIDWSLCISILVGDFFS